MDQLGLGLPCRDYFLNGSDSTLNAYHEYMTSVATIYGADKRFASDEMRRVLDFETRLASVIIKISIESLVTVITILIPTPM